MRWLVVLAAAGSFACKPREGARCRSGLECEGDHALVCIDGRWAKQPCKSGCEPHPFRCEQVDDPRVGESCYDERIAMEGYTSSPALNACSADKTAVLGCSPVGSARWHVVHECTGGTCVHGLCQSAPK